MSVDLQALTDDDLEALRAGARAEQERRAEARRAPAQAAAVVDAVASGRTPDPIRVTGADGRTYTVVVQATPDEAAGPPEWDPATAYSTGVEVTEAGRRYAALKDSTGKQPSTAPTYWQGL